MKDSIGGLYKKESDADQAYKELRKAGFDDGTLSLLARKPKNAPVHSDRVQAPEAGRSAILGALLLGSLGGLLGLLIGLGVIPIPGVDAATYRISAGFVLTALVAGVLAGGVIGAILGTATRLLSSHDKVEITDRGVKRGGLLLVARTDSPERASTARAIMERHGAVDLQNLAEKWDPEVWADFTDVRHPDRSMKP